jgi:hypothetical protein
MSVTALIGLVVVLALALVAESLLASSLAAWSVIGVLVVMFGCVSLLGVWAPKRRDDRE